MPWDILEVVAVVHGRQKNRPLLFGSPSEKAS
jgi:hypothetical protein